MLVQNCGKVNISNAEYYNLYELYDILLTIEEIALEDMVITPYYIDKGKVLEIYDYELSVRVVDNIDINKYLLLKTGKQDVDEIDKMILDKLINCYIELRRIDQNQFLQRIRKSIRYIIKSEELSERLVKFDNTYNENKLFFELY